MNLQARQLNLKNLAYEIPFEVNFSENIDNALTYTENFTMKQLKRKINIVYLHTVEDLIESKYKQKFVEEVLIRDFVKKIKRKVKELKIKNAIINIEDKSEVLDIYTERKSYYETLIDVGITMTIKYSITKRD